MMIMMTMLASIVSDLSPVAPSQAHCNVGGTMQLKSLGSAMPGGRAAIFMCGKLGITSELGTAPSSRISTAGKKDNCDTASVGSGWTLVRRTPGNSHTGEHHFITHVVALFRALLTLF